MAHGHACRIDIRFKMLEHLNVIRQFLQDEAQDSPQSGLWDAVFPTHTTCQNFSTLCHCLPYGLHIFRVTSMAAHYVARYKHFQFTELVEQTSYGCSC
ncbi:hypothetical protein C0J52_17300 [Blattella germanica]|nr:hypothetical protein C0J52_17300 [Blattella germanica]